MNGKLWHRVIQEDGAVALKEVSLETLQITRPTLIYLSGFLTNNDQPGYVSGSIKRMEELLKSAPEGTVQPDIYGWSHKGLSNLFNLAAYDTLPSRYSSNAGYILAHHILMPLVSQQVGHRPDGTTIYNPLSLDEATRRLRNVTFFGYSAGSIVAQETFNATLKMMKTIGYQEKDARKLLKEVVLVAVGSISRPTKETDRFITVSLVASNDRINRFKNWAWGAIGTLRRSFTTSYTRRKNRKRLSIRPLSPSSIFINAAARPSLYEYKTNDAGERIKKNFDPLYPVWMHRRSYHELPHYITTDDKNNDFSRIALYAVAAALNRTSTPDPLKLIELPDNDTFNPTEQTAYQQRIQNALKPTPAKLAQS